MAGCTSNLTKHLRQHGIDLKECTVFDVLRSPSMNVSATASTSQAPGVPLLETLFAQKGHTFIYVV